MKIKKTIFLTCCCVLMGMSSFADTPELPEPPQSARSAAAKPPKPPGSPIDQNLIVLAGCALLFGIYAIRRYNYTKKASI